MDDNTQLPDDDLDLDLEPDDAPDAPPPVDKSKLVSERIKKVRAQTEASTRAQILAELGVSDLTEVKTFLQKEEERKQKEMTEADRARKDAEKLTRERDEALAKVQQMELAQRTQLRNQQILGLATDAEIPQDVLMWILMEKATQLEEAFDEDGNADEKKLKELVKACEQARPTWFRRHRTPGIPSNSPNIRNTGGIPDEPEEDLIKKARKKGYFG